MIKMVGGPALLLFVTAATIGANGRTEVTAGAGTGTYSHHYGCDSLVRAPYQEVGVQVRHTRSNGLVVGGQAALRDDDEEAATKPDELRPETRTFFSTWGGYDGRWVRLHAGIVATDYHKPRLEEGRGLELLPRLSLGIGRPQLFVEAGLFDAPMMPAAANGGEGVLSLRIAHQPQPGHELSVGVGAQAADGYVTVSYLARFWRTLQLGGGGYLGESSSGAFVAIGAAIE